MAQWLRQTLVWAIKVLFSVLPTVPLSGRVSGRITYHVIGSALSVVGPSLLQVRQSGTRYRAVSMTWHLAATVSDNR